MKKNKIQKLYEVRSIVPGVGEYVDVPTIWFYPNRKLPTVPYDSSIKAYRSIPKELRMFPEARVRELFTEDEAEKLIHFLVNELTTQTQYREVKLPILPNTFAISLIPNEILPEKMGIGRLRTRGMEKIPMPFEVWGFYDFSRSKKESEIKTLQH